MRIALHPTSEVGIKAGRLLLGERDLDAIGILERFKLCAARVEDRWRVTPGVPPCL